jgi:glycosyltransferase involved in cell wall biosynthesis
MSVGLTRGVCVIGRTDFHTGIGTHTSAAIELFARSLPVSLYLSREDPATMGTRATLPSGRPVDITTDLNNFSVYFYADVLWNGASDYNYTVVPDTGFRIAYVAFDSDRLPPEWVSILNSRFDLVLFPSAHLEAVAIESGVTIAVGTMPIGLDIDKLIARRYVAPISTTTRFGTVSAFHERKGLDLLIDAFLREFEESDDVELVIHSNLAMGDTFARVQALVDATADDRIRLSHGNLSTDAKNALIESFDVYVNASSGEGYSIGPREALALGKPLVLTDLGAHADMAGLSGVFFVPAAGRAPARYPEIDNRVFGAQKVFTSSTLGHALREARNFALSPLAATTSAERKRRAAEFSLTRMEAKYRELVDPGAPIADRKSIDSPFTRIPLESRALASRAAGPHGGKIGRRKIVLPAHDAGFFSLFNVLATHLVWSMQETSPPMILPDWDAGRLIERSNGEKIVSYCYSQPADGNMWLSLFEPLYDLSADDMNNVDFLYGNSNLPDEHFNGRREPLLTYTNAFDLYQAPWFSRFRTQYSSIIRDRVRLVPEYQTQIDDLRERLSSKFTIAAHVKHPSHSIEQPGGIMAERHQYVTEVREALKRRGINESSDDWGVFVATDQQRVVQLFSDEFGDHVIHMDDVTRISLETDSEFDSLPAEERSKEGHQLQHLMAADSSAWSTRLAWEVWRDAEAMAASDVLIHAVSNVAAAVSYLGDVDMVYCDPEAR